MKNIFEITDNFLKNRDIKSELVWGDLSAISAPRVTIIIPTYSHPEYFRMALISSVNQDFKDAYEIIVVDNNPESSEENKNAIIVSQIASKKVLYYRNNQNLGMYGNWNRGIELARAPFITFCHDDDVLLPSALTRLMELQKKTGNKAIFSSMNEIDKYGEVRYNHQNKISRKFFFLQRRDWYNYTLFHQFIKSAGFGCGCLFSRECLIHIGGYNELYYPSADYALQILYTFKYGSIYNQIPTFNYRIAENESLSVYKQFIEADEGFRNIIKNKLLLPRFISNRIIKANKRISSICFAIRWGNAPRSLYNRIKLFDKIIMNMCTLLCSLNTYKISLRR